MSIYLYAAFILACIALAITPGPSMALFLANSAAHGTRAALLTVLGGAVGLSVLVAGATLGMTSVMALMADWFNVIRWIGAAYLVWLGIGRLRVALRQTPLDDPQPRPRRGRWFMQGTATALSNPKVLLFLGAFFPQFIDPAVAVGPQLALLAVTFVVVLAAVDTTLVFAFGSARGWIMRQQRFAEGVSGVLLVCGGLWLATARRT